MATGGPAAIGAYSTDGLLVSWPVVFAPLTVLGLGVFGTGPIATSLAPIAGTIGCPVVLGLDGALVMGTIGLVLGAGARRLVVRIPRTSIDEYSTVGSAGPHP